MAAAKKAASSGKKLASNVWVDGVLYLAGDSPEKAVADQISNPNAWDGKDEDLPVVGEDAESETS